jgi:UDPglucose--hexose-1-phosphate uridylyltransferase
MSIVGVFMSEGPLDLQRDVHRRFNPLSGEWVLVSPQRTGRPWQGQIEPAPRIAVPAYDKECYLCPGNARAGEARNPDYHGTFAFDNDFPALRPGSDLPGADTEALLRAHSEAGRCRVVCYSPRHDLSLGQLPIAGICQVIDTWAVEYANLAANPRIHAVTIFENRGAMMGASNPHPHGQIWANQTPPPELVKESAAQQRYQRERGLCLLCHYAALETKEAERIVCVNDHFVEVVPFWAVWPFETLVLPRAHVGALTEFNRASREAFAQIVKELTARYDSLFGVEFPYTMGLHQRPTDSGEHAHWHLHLHFYPPLLRSASVRKFMVGYEMLAGPQRDITAEAAARQLREVRVGA